MNGNSRGLDGLHARRLRIAGTRAQAIDHGIEALPVKAHGQVLHASFGPPHVEVGDTEGHADRRHGDILARAYSPLKKASLANELAVEAA